MNIDINNLENNDTTKFSASRIDLKEMGLSQNNSLIDDIKSIENLNILFNNDSNARTGIINNFNEIIWYL